jgi:hypothetical protein
MYPPVIGEVQVTEFARHQALEFYFNHPDTPTFVDDNEVVVTYAPSVGLSTRTDADDGWHFRNSNGWLATVYDDGRVVCPCHDDSSDPALALERERGTRSEVIEESESMPEPDRSGTVYGQPPKYKPITVEVWVGEPASHEPIKVKVMIEADGDQ